MDKNAIEYTTYKEVADTINTIQKYCDKQLECLLCPIKE